MNTTRIPGFSAEASLYRSDAPYYAHPTSELRRGRKGIVHLSRHAHANLLRKLRLSSYVLHSLGRRAVLCGVHQFLALTGALWHRASKQAPPGSRGALVTPTWSKECSRLSTHEMSSVQIF